MNLDLSLIAGVLESRDLQRAVRAGATADLLTDEAVVMWNLLTDYEDRFHEVPSLQLFQEYYPSYQHQTPENVVEAVIHELKTRKLGTEIQDAVRHIVEINSIDPWKAKESLAAQADLIVTRNQEQVTRHILGTDKRETLALLDSLHLHSGLLGYPWPWDYLNEKTTGLVGGNLVYIYGREKSKKTYLSLYLALFWWSRGLKVLYCTREMTREEIQFISYAMLCGLSIDRYKKGEITTSERESLEISMDMLAESGRFIISEVEGGVAGFRAEVEEVRPHIVVHDCWKAMSDDGMGDKVHDESRYVSSTIEKVKRFAIKAKIPIVLCGHANRDGEKTKGFSGSEHAWSDNIVRRVDLSLRILHNSTMNWLAIIVNRARGMEQGHGFTVNAKLCDGFGVMVEPNVSWAKDYDETIQEEKKSHDRTQQDKLPAGVPLKFTPLSFKATFKRK